eukprot:scaffold1505_cov243-Alexandrium_tamarense.AAC.4
MASSNVLGHARALAVDDPPSRHNETTNLSLAMIDIRRYTLGLCTGRMVASSVEEPVLPVKVIEVLSPSKSA